MYAFLLHSIAVRKGESRPFCISEKEYHFMDLEQATDQIRFSPSESSYFHYANEPYITFPNNSRCDDTSLRTEKLRFERTYEIVFGKKPTE